MRCPCGQVEGECSLGQRRGEGFPGKGVVSNIILQRKVRAESAHWVSRPGGGQRLAKVLMRGTGWILISGGSLWRMQRICDYRAQLIAGVK